MSLVRKQFTRIMLVGALSLFGASAKAALVEVIAGNVEPTPVYGGPGTYGPQGEWHIEDAGFSGGIVTPFDGTPTYFINLFGFATESNFDWTGSTLAADTSSLGRASASFNAGGTLRIYGSLEDEFLTPVFSGLLLEGTLSTFSVYEPDTPNFIDVDQSAVFTPTGGALTDGSFGFTMTPEYIVTFTAAEASQLGGPLFNFADDIEMVEGYKIVMSSTIPEPASLVLLGLAGVLGLRRR